MYSFASFVPELIDVGFLVSTKNDQVNIFALCPP